jgi:apolipoprotein N-acyltransferase
MRPVAKIIPKIFIFLAPVLSGFLLVLAFPSYDLGWLVWAGLVPLLIAISGRSPKYGFFLSFVCGVIFFAGTFNWVFEIPGYKFLHHVFLIPYMGLYFGLFGLAFSFISKRWGVTSALLAAPFVWVSLEYVRSNLSFLALPWAFLGHSQHQYPLIIQIASFTGAYGISFLVVMVNSAIAATIFSLSSRLEMRRTAIPMMLATGLFTGLTLSYGQIALMRPIARRTIKTSVLQGNIDREMKANPKKNAKFIVQKYADLTKQAAQDQPTLIVWPEAATPGLLLKNLRLLDKTMTLIREVNAHFIIGSSEYPKFIKGSFFKPENIGNTALFFSPKGKFLGQYLKIHLVPFGEYIPFEGTVPWPHFIVPEEKKTYEIPGKEFTLFRLEGAKFGVLICWEIVFPELFRQFVKNGANFMLNITNEGWFGETAAPYQLAAVSVFRAVENRVSLARAANTGISCFIDPFGRITGRVQNNNKDIFVEGYLTQEIRLTQEKTLYTQYGDIFVYVCLILAAVIIALSLFRTKR